MNVSMCVVILTRSALSIQSLKQVDQFSKITKMWLWTIVVHSNYYRQGGPRECSVYIYNVFFCFDWSTWRDKSHSGKRFHNVQSRVKLVASTRISCEIIDRYSWIKPNRWRIVRLIVIGVQNQWNRTPRSTCDGSITGSFFVSREKRQLQKNKQGEREKI